MRVFVYYNLHRHLFSIRASEGVNQGRVIAHRPEVYLTDVRFRVSEAGRQRVLREQRKNVHAGVAGLWDDRLQAVTGSEVTYNPYRWNSFVTRQDQARVTRAREALLTGRQIVASGLDI